MNVSVIVGGRFHAFDLAREIQRRGALTQLITTYPRSATARWGIDSRKVVSFPLKEVVSRALAVIPGINIHQAIDVFLASRFAAQAARVVAPADVVVAWSGFALPALQIAKKRGEIAILERGSSHIEEQQRLLREEYQSVLGKDYRIHPWIVERETEEYDTADYIAIPSGFVEESFVRRGFSPNRLLRMPYGVDLSQFFPGQKRDRTFRIIHCGAISVRKGVHYLVQAFSELNLPGAELWLIGAVAPELRSTVRRWSSSGIRMLGPFRQAVLRDYYAQASVFCLASIEEGLAMVQAQAMACGLPVICTQNTGGADLIRDGIDGFIVKPRDVSGLKERILQLYNRPQLAAEMGSEALRRVSSGFSWSDYGDRVLRAYGSALNSTRSPRTAAVTAAAGREH